MSRAKSSSRMEQERRGVRGVKMMKNEIGYIWRGGRGAMGRRWGREK